MSPRAKTAAGLVGLGIVVLLAVGWPASAGGGTTYLAVRGASMRPAVAAGDFAVVRRGGTYRVGDVAAYRSASLHHVVLHRIAAVDGSTYTFKGDANSFNDPEQVGRSAIVGSLALRVPRVGSALLWLAHPLNAMLLVLAIVLLWWDRSRLRSLLVRGELPQTPPVVEAPSEPSWDVGLDRCRVVTIADLSFPHELAIADVVAAEDLTRLAERYDRPILHDATSDVLFVVESGMLYRCAVPVEQPLGVAATLSIVRASVEDETKDVPFDDAEPYEQLAAYDETQLADEIAAFDDDAGLEPAMPTPVATPRARRWYDRPAADRRHTPQGRDWGYAGAPVHAPVGRARA